MEDSSEKQTGHGLCFLAFLMYREQEGKGAMHSVHIQLLLEWSNPPTPLLNYSMLWTLLIHK